MSHAQKRQVYHHNGRVTAVSAETGELTVHLFFYQSKHVLVPRSLLRGEGHDPGVGDGVTVSTYDDLTVVSAWWASPPHAGSNSIQVFSGVVERVLAREAEFRVRRYTQTREDDLRAMISVWGGSDAFPRLGDQVVGKFAKDRAYVDEVYPLNSPEGQKLLSSDAEETSASSTPCEDPRFGRVVSFDVQTRQGMVRVGGTVYHYEGLHTRPNNVVHRSGQGVLVTFDSEGDVVEVLAYVPQPADVGVQLGGNDVLARQLLATAAVLGLPSEGEFAYVLIGEICDRVVNFDQQITDLREELAETMRVFSAAQARLHATHEIAQVGGDA